MGTYSYWQHFLALEADFATTSRYVEFSEENFGTYSIEYAKLLLATGSEIDVICKIICQRIDAAVRRKNMDDYRSCVHGHTSIATEEILIRRYGLSFKPWDDWSRGGNPKWWKSYNDVKHERNVYFSDANFENCANAISALFVAVIYAHKAETSNDSLEPSPVLLGRDREPGNLALESGYSVPEFT